MRRKRRWHSRCGSLVSGEKSIVSLGSVRRIFRGRRIIFGRGFGRLGLRPAKGCVSPVGHATLRIALDKFVSRNLFAQSAVVRKDLPELSMIPQIKRRSVYLVVTGDLYLQPSDGAAGTTETSCVRAPDGPVIDYDQHREAEDCFGQPRRFSWHIVRPNRRRPLMLLLDLSRLR